MRVVKYIIIAVFYCGIGALVQSRAERVTIHDDTNYTIGAYPNTGQYDGYLGAFGAACAGSASHTDAMTVAPSKFPNGTIISWQWPNYPPFSCGIGIWAFLQVSYGNYSGGSYMEVSPKQVGSIDTLIQHHALRLDGELDDFDVIDDFFLTTTAGGSERPTEIEIFLHLNSSAKAFFAGATPIGQVVIDGIEWSVAQQPGDLLFMKSDGTDDLSEPINIKAMFTYLMDQGKLTGEEWYNGHGLGAEPLQGSGILSIDRFSIIYK